MCLPKRDADAVELRMVSAIERVLRHAGEFAHLFRTARGQRANTRDARVTGMIGVPAIRRADRLSRGWPNGSDRLATLFASGLTPADADPQARGGRRDTLVQNTLPPTYFRFISGWRPDPMPMGMRGLPVPFQLFRTIGRGDQHPGCP